MYGIYHLLIAVISCSEVKRAWTTESKDPSYYSFGKKGVLRSKGRLLYANTIHSKEKWTIEVPKTFTGITFLLVKYETRNPKWANICFMDYLDVFQYPAGKKTRKTRLCGNKTGESFTVNGNRADLVFRSRSQKHKGSFLISWSAVQACGGEQIDNGVLTLPETGKSEKHFFCKWRLIANRDGIEIIFQKFQFSEQEYCKRNKIVIYSREGKILRKICSNINRLFLNERAVTVFVYIARKQPAESILARWKSVTYPDNILHQDNFKCGRIEKRSRFKRLVGGSSKYYWPWIVQIRTITMDRHYLLHTSTCGGVIITPYHIVTAAHCLRKEDRIVVQKILIGSSSEFDSQGRWINIKSENIIIHEQYENDEGLPPTNDIAIISFTKRLDSYGRVAPICLQDHRNSVTEDKQCFFAGWGRNRHYPVHSSILKTVNAHSHGHCSGVDSTICVTYGNGDLGACEGDSGSPLMCLSEDNKYYLRSILSYGSHHCPSYVDAHVDIQYYMGWIIETTGVKHLRNES